jgi:DNA-binding transcriptional regulator YdaS (Cro superfamily)
MKFKELTDTMLRLDEEYFALVKTARNAVVNAFKIRWEQGKILYENEEVIKESVGSQKKFAELLGKSEGVLSNNKRAYKFLLDEGCNSWEQVVGMLQQKQIAPTIYSFERIGTLLNEPTKDTKHIDQEEKDRRRIEQLRSELEDIRLLCYSCG